MGIGLLSIGLTYHEPQQMFLRYRRRLPSPDEEIMAQDFVRSENNLLVPTFMNHPDADHLSQNPGIGNGWHNTYHDGHIQWRRFGEHEKWLPIRMSRISGNHRRPQDGNNFTGQPGSLCQCLLPCMV